MLLVQGRRFENPCDGERNPSPRELGGDGLELFPEGLLQEAS